MLVVTTLHFLMRTLIISQLLGFGIKHRHVTIVLLDRLNLHVFRNSTILSSDFQIQGSRGLTG